ncbi:hypothetical protein [Glaciimonas sp. PCH181]|uniref:hypothetical protein n=1 Tax=Glaciimonas sp. PCH181 TaxID=2133943 RepID=UPI000D3A1E54|nr:hypothetical protein [Glaciimonas sp. PCH181]PUA18098.1 hypothetical protein C7W93_19935 [Glaciimonas sp. PCH181]
MFDGFWSGIFGGLFGPVLALWLSRFKYRLIFLFAAFAWQLFALSLGIYYRGLVGFMNIFNDDKSSLLIMFCYSPVGVGIFAVFVALLGSPNTPKKSSEDDKNSS